MNGPTDKAPSIRFHWIQSRGHDLTFYIGSALLGWLYVGIVAYGLNRFDDPLNGAFGTLRWGAHEIRLTLNVLVIASWAILLDAPHIWATLARTLLDPEEWSIRGTVLVRSFLWFGLGPTVILLPYALNVAGAGVGLRIPTSVLPLGAIAFFVFFRLWAYYHVVRQHWGFFQLYKRKANDYENAPRRLETWFFNVVLFAPLALFLTSRWYPDVRGYPNLGLQTAIVGSTTVSDVLHPLIWVLLLGFIAIYIAHQVRLLTAGKTLNGSKLIYMALLIPLHLAAFSHPVLVLFAVPIVTVGHNLQYHRIVYGYGRSKYAETDEKRFRWVRFAFRGVGSYAAIGLIFTFLCYRGPWIEWVQSVLGIELDRVLNDTFGMMAGVRDPQALGIGEQIVAAVLLGWAMQHYYLDSKIWKVGRNADVRRHLRVDGGSQRSSD